MIQNLRDSLNRDCVILHKGDSITPDLDDDLVTAGWRGGSFVKWADGGTGSPYVSRADGTYFGILPYGSNETGDGYTSMAEQNTHYKYGMVLFGGNFFYTRTYEKYGYLARHGLGPETPLTYRPQQLLYISENGLITCENESDLTTFPAHDFPTGGAVPDMSFIAIGYCAVPPSVHNKYYIAVQSTI